jgi:hypothetical protein
MTEDTLISLQSAATRIACQRMTAQHLSALGRLARGTISGSTTEYPDIRCRP